MKKFISGMLLALSAAVLPVSGVLASTGVELPPVKANIHDKQSLQRGAKYFVNYCMGCHSLGSSRYNRVAQDLGLSPEQVKDNFIFTRDDDGELQKPGDLMTNAMRKKYGEAVFGVAPPDLSLSGRLRGETWIYHYLKSFYADRTRPFGVNNTVFPNAGMPHVLWELQGLQRLEVKEEHGHKTETLVLDQPGKLSPAKYDEVVMDLTNFLVYVGEPSKLSRPTIGIFVLIFLVIFTAVAYLLKKEYWKDVH
ncbi:cytochrome c1 [Thiolinea disciformis]|uniref:cytochrome c1 n=1 Tax=Thiolinea disciformis TaxID=125614 RepID=UPI000382A2E9|nr:cytochrome c1 [Thiolinea disciformis]